MGPEHMNTMKCWVAAAVMVALTGTAQAALVNLNNGTIKDTATNLIWRQDWNAFGDDLWATQKAKVENDSFLGFTDWVMSSSTQMTQLLAGMGDSNAQFFTLRRVFNPPFIVWMGDERDATTAYYYMFSSTNTLSWFDKNPDPAIYSGGANWAAAAVRFDDGSTATPTTPPTGPGPSVPEPQTLALVLLALGATVVARSRQAQSVNRAA
jgi:hypothetical protein